MKIKKIIKNAISVLLGLIVVIEILIIGIVIYSRLTGGTPNVFGYNFYVIISPSMEPEISVGDVIISKKYNGEDLVEGQVITFAGKEGSLKGKIVTHKIIGVTKTDDGLKIMTQGVANSTPDPEITDDDVIAVMVHKTVAISFIYRIVSSSFGFLLLIVIPLITIIIIEVVKLIKIVKEDDDEENNKEKH